MARKFDRPESAGHATATSASRVYEELRRDILFGTFRPGTKLLIDGLSTRYDVGSIPIREALNRLSAERLIDQADQRGFFVRSLSVAELTELSDTRCWINEIMVRESLKAATEVGGEWEERLVLAAHHLNRTQRYPAGSKALKPEWEARHRRFHMALLAGCKSQWMQEFHANLFDYTDFYRHQHVAVE